MTAITIDEMLIDPSAEASARVRDGFMPDVAMQLLKFAEDVFSITDVVPPATWSRLSKAGRPLNKQHSEALYHALRAIARTNEVLGADPAVRKSFLTQPNAALGGRRPLKLLAESSVGAESVIRLLDSLSVGGPL